MIDITQKYDWNNHKDMPKKKLYKEYSTLSEEDKNKVYKILNEKRKISLKKEEERVSKEKNNIQLEIQKNDFLNDYINPSDIHTEEELNLIYTIIYSEYDLLLEFKTLSDQDPNRNINIKSFKIQQNNFAETLANMGLHDESNYVFNIQPKITSTLTEILKKYKRAWEEIFVEHKIKPTRAKRIVNDLYKMYQEKSRKKIKRKSPTDFLDLPDLEKVKVSQQRRKCRTIYKKTFATMYEKYGLNIKVPFI